MTVQAASDVPASPAYTVDVVAAAPKPGADITFHQVLSALNPLQYLPVVGTIYRSVTGDTIPEPIRELGSIAVSGLMGGPVGLALNIGLFMAEKLTGIDPEVIGQHLLAELHIGHSAIVSADAATCDAGTIGTAAAAAPTVAPAAEAAVIAPPSDAGGGTGWTAAQLAAYGVTRASDGTLSRGDVHGADVLNALVLARLEPAGSA